MVWNWQQPNWPQFKYDPKALNSLEALFLKQSGQALGAFKHISDDEQDILKIELISEEALKTSKIEGEDLDRDSLQSSIRQHFGLKTDRRRIAPAEQGVAGMMVDLYQTFDRKLSTKTLFAWHKMLMNGRTDLANIGSYRTHKDPMQVVSGAIYEPTVHFEAPPSNRMKKEMKIFIDWFNNTAPNGKTPLPSLTRAGLSHLYFVSIHPFEDGNGRIARALAEKSLAQNLNHPTLIALAYTIEKHRKAYYDALESNNKRLDITDWLIYFANTVIDAQQNTQTRIEFIIDKSKLYERLRGQLNVRQKKVINRMFREGIDGFKGGLSAKNYISITTAPRATATRDLQDLVSKSALIKTGTGRYTRYHLNVPSLLDKDN